MKIDVMKRLGREVDVRRYLPFPNNQNPPGHWGKASLKILCLFFTPGKVRSVSNTHTALDAICRMFRQDVFVDYWFFPAKEDLKVFKSKKVPLIFGNVSNCTVEDYDIVLCSFSIIQEAQNVFYAFRESGIPLLHKDRIKDPRWPLFMAGGITIDALECLHGESGAFDLVYFGQAEVDLPKILKILYDSKIAHPALSKPALLKKIACSSPYVYYPAGYRVKYIDGPDGPTRIESFTKKYDWLTDRVEFARNFDLDNTPLFENKLFNPDNDNATCSLIQISS